MSTDDDSSTSLSDTEEYVTCPICYEKFDNGEHSMRVLRCGHVFGKRCINEWIKDKKRSECPICKSKFYDYDVFPLYLSLKTVIIDNSKLAELREKEKEYLKRINDLEESNAKLFTALTKLRAVHSAGVGVIGMKELYTDTDAVGNKIATDSEHAYYYGKSGIRQVLLSDPGRYAEVIHPSVKSRVSDIVATPGTVIFSQFSGEVSVLDKKSPSVSQRFSAQTKGIWSMATDADHQMVLLGNSNGSVLIYDLRKTDSVLDTVAFQRAKGPVFSLDTTTEGDVVFSGSWGAAIKRHNSFIMLASDATSQVKAVKVQHSNTDVIFTNSITNPGNRGVVRLFESASIGGEYPRPFFRRDVQNRSMFSRFDVECLPNEYVELLLFDDQNAVELSRHLFLKVSGQGREQPTWKLHSPDHLAPLKDLGTQINPDIGITVKGVSALNEKTIGLFYKDSFVMYEM